MRRVRIKNPKPYQPSPSRRTAWALILAGRRFHPRPRLARDETPVVSQRFGPPLPPSRAPTPPVCASPPRSSLSEAWTDRRARVEASTSKQHARRSSTTRTRSTTRRARRRPRARAKASKGCSHVHIARSSRETYASRDAVARDERERPRRPAERDASPRTPSCRSPPRARADVRKDEHHESERLRHHRCAREAARERERGARERVLRSRSVTTRRDDGDRGER